MSIQQRLADLGISLPPVAVPAAAYVPFVRTGNLVFLSGHIAKRNGQVWVGQLGRDINTAEGQQAARAVAIDLLGTLQAAVGDLEKITRIVKVMSLVNSTASFTDVPPLNGTDSPISASSPIAGCACSSPIRTARCPAGSSR